MPTITQPRLKRIVGYIDPATDLVHIDGIEPFLSTTDAEDCPRITLPFRPTYLSLNCWAETANPTAWNVGVSTFCGDGIPEAGLVCEQIAVAALHDDADTMGLPVQATLATTLVTAICIRQGVVTWGTCTKLWFEVVLSAP